MASSSGLYFQLHQTAEAFINSYDQEKCAEDITNLSTTLTPDCKRYISPSNTDDGSPALSNSDYETLQSREFSLAAARSIEIRDITVDEVQRKAAVYSLHRITLNEESGGKTWEFEIMFTLWMTREGTKIERINQFVDSQAAARFREEVSWVCPDDGGRGVG